MNVNNTLDLLAGHAPLSNNPEGLTILRDDIIQSIKFNLGSEFTDTLGYEFDEGGLDVPKLPYDKVYIEAVSIDGKRYGAIFENFETEGVCGQMLVEARSEGSKPIKGLFPIGLTFLQDGDKMSLHYYHDEKYKSKQVAAIVALNLMIKAIAVMNCSNVITVDSKEQKHINRKRKEKGKLPIFTYKTLHIYTGVSEQQKGGLKGNHNSPRVHLRRGHIRRLSEDKTVWVQPCVVGDKSKGIIHKDYSVH